MRGCCARHAASQQSGSRSSDLRACACDSRLRVQPMSFVIRAHACHSCRSTGYRVGGRSSRVRDLVLGKYRDELPPSNVALWVDVRDLAEAHAKSLEVPEAGGNRFFTTAGYFSNKRVAEAVRKSFPELDDKLPSKDTPDDFVKSYEYDNSKSIKVLKLSYRSLDDSIKDTVESIKEVEAI